MYIFRGGPKGIQSRDTSFASQVIDAARDIDPRLRGFGFSLAGGGGISNQDTTSGDNGLDLDGNKYPDLIVGSPFSGQAVYLRYEDYDLKCYISCGNFTKNKITHVTIHFSNLIIIILDQDR